MLDDGYDNILHDNDDDAGDARWQQWIINESSYLKTNTTFIMSWSCSTLVIIAKLNI